MEEFDFSRLKDFYLLKCFSNEEYRKQFNTGEKTYINSTEYFHSVENCFQKDFEGGIYHQGNNRGMIVLTKNEKSADDIFRMYKSGQFDDDTISVSTNEMKIFFNGFICCFAIFNKKEIRFEENAVVFNPNSNSQKEFYDYLNDYAKDKYAFFSVYDAEKFMNAFCPSMKQRGYSLDWGPVKYEEFSNIERVEKARNGQFRDILFTKDKKLFSQQKEFRIFISKNDGSKLDHIEETGIDVSGSVLKDMVYLSPEYANKIGYKNYEV